MTALPIGKSGTAPWVEDISVDSVSEEQILIHLPDTATVLVWRATGEVLAMGPRTHASYHAGKNVPVCVRIRLRPGSARSLLGVTADELTDRIVPMSELWGKAGTRLAEQFAEIGPDPVQLVEKSLLATMSAGNTSLVRHATASLSTGMTVRAAARRLGISERHLRAVFTREIGVSPGHFARISRTRAVLAGARSRPLAQLAAETGYYDQSHMTADFRRIMHVTPAAFTAGRLPAAVGC